VLRPLLLILMALAVAGCEGAPQPLQIHGVNFVGVSVADLEKTNAFYGESTNLQPLEVDASGMAQALQTLAESDVSLLGERLLRSSNAQLRIMQFSATASVEPTPVNGTGIAHVCYQVNSETQTYPLMLEKGGVPIGSPEMVRINDRNPVDYAYLHDPDGTIVEVEHVDVAALNLEEPPANDYRIRHVSLATPDMGAMLSFYSHLLAGQKPRRAGRFLKLSGEKLDKVSGLPDTEIQMAWFQIRNLELELVQYHSHPPANSAEARPINAIGYNMIVFDVHNLDGVQELVLDAGGVLVGEPLEVDGGKIQFGRDPDGNLLGFQVTEADAAVSSINFKNNGI